MDSKTVNKLIRSEVWPLLRRHGFSKFTSRNASRRRGHFTHAVNFQSFNSYLAGSIGCTTFSFAVNLTASVGGIQAFQTVLRKTTPVDGFARDDVFFIDTYGITIGVCIREVCALLADDAERWFDYFCDLDQVIANVEASGQNCCASHELLATMRFLRGGRADVEQLIGAIYDLPTMLESPGKREEQVRKVFHLAGWNTNGLALAAPEGGTELRELRPALRHHGFREFSGRLAHRIGTESIHVVEGGKFIDVGIFWPGLPGANHFRIDRNCNPRPRAAECPLTHRTPSLTEAFEWFESFGTNRACLAFLLMKDSELFRRFPLMRGFGARTSARRGQLLSHLTQPHPSHAPPTQFSPE